MKPGWVRRWGFDLIAVGFGGPMLLFGWSMNRGMQAGSTNDTWAMDIAVHWSVWFVPFFYLGVILAIFGGAKHRPPNKAS